MNTRLSVNNAFLICCCSTTCLLFIFSVFPNLSPSPAYSSADVFEKDRSDELGQDDSSDSSNDKSKANDNDVNSEDESDNAAQNSDDNEENNLNDHDTKDSVSKGVNMEKWSDFKSTLTNSSDLNTEISKSGEFRAVLTQYNGSQTVFARLSGAAVGDTNAP